MRNASPVTAPNTSIILILYGLLFLSMTFSWRAVSSIGIGCIIVAGIYFGSKETWSNFPKYLLPLLISCFLFLAIQFAGYPISDNKAGAVENIRQKSGMVLIPLAFILFPIGTNMVNPIRKLYCLVISSAAVICICLAIINYFGTGVNTFFYHSLASHISQHAVYLSFLVILALVLLITTAFAENLFKPGYTALICMVCTLFLFMLSSKLMIGFFLLFLAIFFFRKFIQTRLTGKKLVVASAGLVLTIIIAIGVRNPVSDRYREIIHTDITIIESDRFDPGDYFDGLQFRLLQWKFVGEILSEKNAWFTGIGTGDGQETLDRKYREKNMYMGENGGKGYRGYNTHNQFLETILQNGIPGLSLLIFIFIFLAAATRKSLISFSLVILLFAWSFTESILETQYGLLFFFTPILFRNSH